MVKRLPRQWSPLVSNWVDASPPTGLFLFRRGNMTGEFVHKSVLLEECLDHLAIRSDGVYVDGTLGGAGHSSQILRRLGDGGVLIGLDQDRDAIAVASRRLAQVESRGRYLVRKTNFCDMVPVCRELGFPQVDGILLDLGVSSYQLDQADRGFSYRFDARLDMRMNQDGGKSAYDVVNEYEESALCRVIHEYGEERYAARIARRIVESRKTAPVETTGQLVELIRSAIPQGGKPGEGHPAKRTFQAIRIEVNRELDVLQSTLTQAIDLLAPGGRLCVISFHSLEDRLVKNAMRNAEHPCQCPSSFPICVCGRKSQGEVISRKPILPSPAEEQENPRAKSAKLRVFEKRKDKTV